MKPPPTILTRFGRAVAGFGIGWAISSAVALAWCGLGAAFYGDLETALERFKGDPDFVPVISAALAGMVGSWMASTVGPLLLGQSRLNRPILSVAAHAGGLAAFTTTFSALALGVLFQGEVTKEVSTYAALAVGILFGALTGWRVAQIWTLPRSS